MAEIRFIYIVPDLYSAIGPRSCWCVLSTRVSSNFMESWSSVLQYRGPPRDSRETSNASLMGSSPTWRVVRARSFARDAQYIYLAALAALLRNYQLFIAAHLPAGRSAGGCSPTPSREGGNSSKSRYRRGGAGRAPRGAWHGHWSALSSAQPARVYRAAMIAA